MPVIEIPATEQGVIRVFAISRPVADMARALKQAPKVAVASELLGRPVTDADIELFPVSDLTGVGLQSYLADGYDVDAGDLRADNARLAALDGYALLLFSSVAGTEPVTLTPHADLTLIGTYSEPMRNHAAAPVAVEAALPYSGASAEPARPSRKRVGSSISALVVLALLILIWWILR